MIKAVNLILIVLGIISFILGVIGVVLPILPTTPFLLLAAFLFARSSNKFHQWLLGTNIYKKHIDLMINKKEMTFKSKVKTLAILTVIFTVGIIAAPIWHVKVFIIVIALGHYFYFTFKIRTIDEEKNVDLTMYISKKREDEKEVIKKMIEIYCKGNKHKIDDGTEVCNECSKLLDYAHQRVDKCPFMETKTFCSACKVHCYKKDMKEQIRNVMKYSGPRMLFIDPGLTLKHAMITLKSKKK